VVNKVSQNLHAEMMLREATLHQRGDATAEDTRKELHALLDELKIPRESYHFEDGSGLSSLTLVSPETIVALLTAIHISPRRDDFWALLPVAGEDGTLAARFHGVAQASAIRAKTGSLSHVAALSGYAGLDPDQRVAFSIMVNGYTAPASVVRPLIDKIAVALLEETTR
jgi:D-alanyl-D-alanine carboxypeptidase/D-alanyl-D-alanine-endopeptidase (penicillin-binding protein 4)